MWVCLDEGDLFEDRKDNLDLIQMQIRSRGLYTDEDDITIGMP